MNQDWMQGGLRNALEAASVSIANARMLYRKLEASPSTPSSAEAEETPNWQGWVAPVVADKILELEEELDSNLLTLYDRLGQVEERLDRWLGTGLPGQPTMEKGTKTNPLGARDTGSINQMIRQSLRSDPPTTEIYRAAPGCECAQLVLSFQPVTRDWVIACQACGVWWLRVLIVAPVAPVSATE